MIQAELKPLAQILSESDITFVKYGPGMVKTINHPHSNSHSLTIPMSIQYYGRIVFIEVKNDYSKVSPPRIIYNVYYNKKSISKIVPHFQAYDCWFNWIEDNEFLPQELFEI